MKSILKQALTVVLLLSVPALFAADVAKEATRLEKAKNVVVGAAKAGYNKSAAFASATKNAAKAKFFTHVWKENGRTAANVARTGLLVTAAGLVTYGVVQGVKKLASMYRDYIAKKATKELGAGKEAAQVEQTPAASVAQTPAPVAVVAPAAAPVVKTAEQVAADAYAARLADLEASNAARAAKTKTGKRR